MTADVAAGGAVTACIERARTLLHNAVDRANARRATAFDPMRGLYVTEAEVAEILAGAAHARAPQSTWTLPQLAALRLPFAVHDAIALAVAAEYVPRLDRVYGFLHDDLTRRTLTTGLLVDMLDLDPLDCAPDALLVRLAVLNIAPHETPLAASVRVDRGFLAALAGEARLDARIHTLATVVDAPRQTATPHAERAESPLVLWGAGAADLAAAARDTVAAAGRAAVRLADGANDEHVGIAAREALLRDAVLIVAAGEPIRARAVALAARELPVTVVIEAAGGIAGYEGPARRVASRDAAAASAPAGYPLPYGRRVLPRRTFADLILPPPQLRAVRAVADRCAKRDVVTRDWGVDTGSSAGGVRALFAGPPGTGKTLAAEALAHVLGRDLYVIDVSTVVSKYIGETEKALATVFAEAARAGVCLFFDEADALFGKRTETSDAHDRYANIETAYLLQALDTYADLAVLATNLAGNIDDALVRRIDVKIEFPMPDAAARRALWRRSLGRAPLDGVDLDELARRLPLSGGGIQSAALAAAFRAAADGRAVAMLDLLRAARDELAKMGRVAGRLELGAHEAALRAEERA